MKKIFILLIFCLILSGCKTEVNITVSEDKIIENTKIYDIKENVYQNGNIKEDINFYITTFEREYEFYTIKTFEKNNIIGKTYDYEVPIDIWHEASRLRSCYDSVKILKNEKYLTIETSNEYRCGYLYGANDVVLNLISDLDARQSNADKIDGNKNTWHINESNYKNKKIKIIYALKNKKEKDVNLKENKNKINKNKVIIVVLGIISTLSITSFIFYKKYKKNKLEY